MKYYQQNDLKDMPSFVVYFRKENLIEQHPGVGYKEYRDSEIEAPRIIDLTPDLFVKNKEILKFCLKLLTNQKKDELVSFLDINKIEPDNFYEQLCLFIKRTKSTISWKGIIFDDFVVNRDISNDKWDGGFIWSQICEKCCESKKIDDSRIDDSGNGICGVEHCQNEAQHYIDFNIEDLNFS
ncbi:MAG: hypothetical protein GY909_16000 [Oligoflexia bacterium]|nr:hypothetical protein [Oligoflexia bacterium]